MHVSGAEASYVLVTCSLPWVSVVISIRLRWVVVGRCIAVNIAPKWSGLCRSNVGGMGGSCIVVGRRIAVDVASIMYGSPLVWRALSKHGGGAV